MTQPDVLDGLNLDSPHEFRSSQGLVLALKKVSKYLVVDKARQLKAPKVPVITYTLPDGSVRSEPNQTDPDYVEDMRTFNYEQGMTSMQMYLALGSSIKVLPPDLTPPEDDSWVADLAEWGVEPAKAGRRRYTDWLKYHALVGNEYDELTQAVMRYSGLVLEGDVAKAADDFPGHAERRADPNGRAS